MSDRLDLNQTTLANNTTPTPKDNTPDPDDCCVIPPGGSGDPGPGGAITT
jgi:hypothetical protein